MIYSLVTTEESGPRGPGTGKKFECTWPHHQPRLWDRMCGTFSGVAITPSSNKSYIPPATAHTSRLICLLLLLPPACYSTREILPAHQHLSLKIPPSGSLPRLSPHHQLRQEFIMSLVPTKLYLHPPLYTHHILCLA